MRYFSYDTLFLGMLLIFTSSAQISKNTESIQHQLAGCNYEVAYSQSVITKASKPDTNCLDFRINLSKSQFLEGEPVWLELTTDVAKNCKLDYTPLLDPWFGYVKLLLISNNGDTIHDNSGIAEGNPVKYYPDHLFEVYDLENSYGHSISGQNEFRTVSVPIGKYKLSAEIRFSMSGKEFKATSNTLSFEVTKPTGNELEEQKEFVDLALTKTNTKEEAEKFKTRVDDFENKYPNSVYKNRVYSFLVTVHYPEYIYYLTESERSEFLIQRMIKNPDDYYNKFYMNQIIIIGNTVENAQTALDGANRLLEGSNSRILKELCSMRIFYAEQWIKSNKH